MLLAGNSSVHTSFQACARGESGSSSTPGPQPATERHHDGENVRVAQRAVRRQPASPAQRVQQEVDHLDIAYSIGDLAGMGRITKAT